MSQLRMRAVGGHAAIWRPVAERLAVSVLAVLSGRPIAGTADRNALLKARTIAISLGRLVAQASA